MKEFLLDELSEVVEEIIFALEDSIHDKLNDKSVHFTSMDFKAVKHILVKHLAARKPSNQFYCTHCDNVIDEYPHACKGYYAPSPETRYWLDDQASINPYIASSCMKGVHSHGSKKVG